MSVFSKKALTVFLLLLIISSTDFKATNLDQSIVEKNSEIASDIALETATSAGTENDSSLVDWSLKTPGVFSSDKIRIEGNQRIDTQTIISLMDVRSDGKYTTDDLNNIIRRLIATGLFLRVDAKLVGGTLVLSVAETAWIGKIAFEGNKVISDNDLIKTLAMTPKSPISTNKITECQETILEFYKAKGRYAATVTTEMIQRPSNIVDVIFKITEGPKALISRVIFKGNLSFSTKELSGVITSKKKKWYSFLGDPNAIYDPEKLDLNRMDLIKFYQKQGYMDVEITDAYGELSPDKKNFIVSFHIKEGKRYTFGRTTIVSESPSEVPTICLKQVYSWKTGDYFDMIAVENTAKMMTSDLTSQGLPFYEVVAEQTQSGTSRDIQFIIRPITPCYAGHITIRGNSRTEDRVIRRALLFKKGDPVTPLFLKFSEIGLKNLGIFENMEIVQTESETNPQISDFDVRVKESKTATNIIFSAGHNSSQGFLLQLGVVDKNFMGRGQAVAINATVAKTTQNLTLSGQIPYFMNRQVVVGGALVAERNMGYTNENFDTNGSYSQKKLGSQINVQYSLGSGVDQSWAYRPSVEALKFLSQNTATYLTNNISEHNTRFISTIQHQISYTKNLSPKSACRLFTINTYTGLGGSVQYMTNAFCGSLVYSFDENQKYRLRLEAKYQIFNKSKNSYARFMDQFNVGGLTFPGFQNSGIGPRDQRTGDALGGRQAYLVSMKLDVPIPSPEDFPLRGCFHAHMGSLWSSMFIEQPGYPINSQGFKNRFSIGFGIFTDLPMVGKIGIIFSRAIAKEACDRVKGFELVVGTDF